MSGVINCDSRENVTVNVSLHLYHDRGINGTWHRKQKEDELQLPGM